MRTQPPTSGFERLIPTKNPPALIGYYLGVFSLIPCVAMLLGPTAIVFGILALPNIKKSPILPGKGHAIAALALGGLTSLVNYGFVIVLAVSASTSRP